MHPKDAEGIAKSVDPDQTAPRGAVWSGSALFAQICPSEILGKLRYYYLLKAELNLLQYWLPENFIYCTVMILSFRTDMPGQTVQTQIRL